MSELPKPTFSTGSNQTGSDHGLNSKTPELPKSAMPSPTKPTVISDFLHKYGDAVRDAIKRADDADSRQR